MSTDVESIVQLLRMLPPPAVEQVADFANYLFRKHVRAAVDERVARRTANRWLVERVVDATTGEILTDERAVEDMKQLGTSLQ
jgi:hypothetical protein